MGGVTPKEPKSLLNKPLKADFRGFFTSMSKLLIKGALRDKEGAAENAVDALDAIGLECTLEERAWQLLKRSLLRAVATLIAEQIDFIREDEDSEAFAEQIDNGLRDVTFELTADFFNHPEELPILERLRPELVKWLVGQGLKEEESQAVASRLPSYFSHGLVFEWARHTQDYKAILEFFDTPFSKADDREAAWLKYRASLVRQADEAVFGSWMGLKDIYIPLRGWCCVEEKHNPMQKQDLSSKKDTTQRPVQIFDMHEKLHAWLERGDKNQAIRVIAGLPGCGKSSFLKMFAAQLAKEGKHKVLLIPLHRFDLTSDLTQSVGNYVRDTGILSGGINPLDPEKGEKKLVLLFDGLDELSKAGSVSENIAGEFVDYLLRTVDRRNATELHLQVVLSGRLVAIQGQQSKFRQPEQVLTLLPYHVTEPPSEKIKDGEELLQIDQRNDWWRQWGEATRHPIKEMPQEFRREDLDEITTQPLLNYLLALVHQDPEFDILKDTGLNDIYDHFLKQIFDRVYEQKRVYTPIEGLDEDVFRHLLEEIAATAWHHRTRLVSTKAVQETCKKLETEYLLEQKCLENGKNISPIFLSFYFNMTPQTGKEHSYEFTHKSFCEYLTACRIVRGLEQMHKEWEHARQKPQKVLVSWVRLCGPTAIDGDLLPFIHREIARQPQKDVKNWQKMLIDCINYVMHEGMPMEQIYEIATHFEKVRQARNAEECLLVSHSACGLATGEKGEINEREIGTFGTWLYWLQKQRIIGLSCVALLSLNHLNFSGCQLYSHDFYGARLNSSILINVELKRANLIFANLSSATLSNANLFNANLSSANLSSANLSDANLSYADLSDANLTDANLSGATLSNPNLSYADLSDANLTDANLSGADLSYANLTDANLSGATLSNANLSYADLSDADLSDANLFYAKLTDANLTGANLSGATLSNANLSYADLLGANFDGITFNKHTRGLPRAIRKKQSRSK